MGKPDSLCTGGFPITFEPCPECGATERDLCGRPPVPEPEPEPAPSPTQNEGAQP